MRIGWIAASEICTRIREYPKVIHYLSVCSRCLCMCVCVSACGEANSALQIAKQMDLKRFTLNGISQPLPKATKQKQKQQVIRWNGLHVRRTDTLYISNTFDQLEIRDLILQQGISMCGIKLFSQKVQQTHASFYFHRQII